MNSRVLRRDLVRVHLVAAEEEQIGVARRVRLEQGARQGVQGVEAPPILLVALLGQGVRGLVRQREPAGAEHELDLLPLAEGAQDARREARVRGRPGPLAVERDLVFLA